MLCAINGISLEKVVKQILRLTMFLNGTVYNFECINQFI